jgi:hypothetical protein
MLGNTIQLLHQGCAPGTPMCNGGGGKGGSSPDYTPMGNASKEAAATAYKLGQQQLAENRRMYDESKATIDPIIKAQTSMMQSQQAQGDDYYKYMKDTYRPIETQLTAEAKNAGGKADQDEATGLAAGDVQRGFDAQRGQLTRSLQASGVDPSSGRMVAGLRDVGAQQAASSAAAMTGARTQARQLGYAKRMDMAGLGRGLAGASSGAYAGAVGAGSAGAGNRMNMANSYIGGMTAGNGTIMQGQGLNIQGQGSILNSQTQMAGYGAQEAAGYGQAVGTVAALGLRYSDHRLKKDIVFVGVDPNTGYKLYEFEYIKGPEGKRYRGVMADEILEVKPEAVITMDSGYYAVDYDALGIEMVEV